jgi:hypothetical protein
MQAYKPIGSTFSRDRGSLNSRVQKEMAKGLDNAAKDAIGRLEKGIGIN